MQNWKILRACQRMPELRFKLSSAPYNSRLYAALRDARAGCYRRQSYSGSAYFPEWPINLLAADEMIKREALKVDLGRPVGSVEFRLVRFHSVDAVKSIVQGKDPACASKIDALVDEAFKDVPYNKLLRGLKILPVPPALDALRQGALYPWKPVP